MSGIDVDGKPKGSFGKFQRKMPAGVRLLGWVLWCLFWGIPLGFSMLFGDTAFATSMGIFATAVLVLSLIVCVSIFRGSAVSSKKWSYRFLSDSAGLSKVSRRYTRDGINICDLVPLTGFALFNWLILAPTLLLIAGIVIGVVYVVGFFVAARPPILKDEEPSRESLLIPYTKWWRIRGYRVMPIVPILFLGALWGMWILLKNMPSLLESIRPSTATPLLGEFLGGFALVSAILFGLSKYRKTQHWHEAREAIRMLVRSRVDRFCVVQPVKNDDE